MLVYNYDGDIYISDESRMLAEMKDFTFRLGNVHQHSRREIFGSDAFLEAQQHPATKAYRAVRTVRFRLIVARIRYSTTLPKATASDFGRPARSATAICQSSSTCLG